MSEKVLRQDDPGAKLTIELWQKPGTPGGEAMRLLKENECCLDFRASNGKWYLKTNVGRGDDWLCGVEGTCEENGIHKPSGVGAPYDVIFWYHPELNYPFVFEKYVGEKYDATGKTKKQIAQELIKRTHEGLLSDGKRGGLIGAFANAAHKGYIKVTGGSMIWLLARKNYPVAGQILGSMKVNIVPKHRYVEEKPMAASRPAPKGADYKDPYFD